MTYRVFGEGVSEQTALECVATYLEVAFDALDRGDIGMARACLRRMAQYLLIVERVSDQ